MRDFLWRFTHDRDGNTLNPLMHIFFFVTLINGLFFTFSTHSDSVKESALYRHTTDAFGNAPLPIWGVCAMLVVAINTVAIVFRHRSLLGWGGMLGFGVWCFAAFIYLQDGLWFQLLAGAIPQIAFWAWYYFRVKWYYK